jgi:hypothetical protein
MIAKGQAVGIKSEANYLVNAALSWERQDGSRPSWRIRWTEHDEASFRAALASASSPSVALAAKWMSDSFKKTGAARREEGRNNARLIAAFDAMLARLQASHARWLADRSRLGRNDLEKMPFAQRARLDGESHQGLCCKRIRRI